MISDEERNVENDCSGDDIHPDSSADGAGNDILHGNHVEERGMWKEERG